MKSNHDSGPNPVSECQHWGWRTGRSPQPTPSRCIWGLLGCLLLFELAGIAAQEESAPLGSEGPGVERFKELLSTTPCVRSVKFAQIEDSTRQTWFFAARCGTNFFLRQVAEKEDLSARISTTNAATYPFFVGSVRAKNWTLTALTITEANTAAGDLYPQMGSVAAGKKTLSTVLAMGCDLVQPGTFTWNGRAFRATGTRTLASSSNEIPEVEGTIVVQDGVVIQLVLLTPWSARIRYDHDPASHLPLGVPSRIHYDMNGKDVGGFQIDSLEFDEAVEDSRFEPLNFIEPSIARVDVLTNGQRMTVRDNTQALIAAIRTSATPPQLYRRKIAGWFFLLASGGLTAYLVWLYRKRTSSDQTREKEM